MKCSTLALTAVVAGIVLLACPDRAEARRRIPFIVNSGDHFFAKQPVPAELKVAVQDATHLGYHCQHFGLFYLTLWTWDGCWCVYNDNTYYELPDEVAAAALGVSGSNPGKPFFYRFPFGLFLLSLIVVAWGGWETVKYQVNARSNRAAQPSKKPSPKKALLKKSPPKKAPQTALQPDPSFQLDELAAMEEDPLQKQAGIEEHVTRLVSEGKVDDAHRLYVNSQQKLGVWDLPPKTLLAMIVALDRQKRHPEVLPLLLRYVQLVPNAPTLLKLKLAQLLLTVEPRPSKALEVLNQVPLTSLDEKTEKIHAQLRAQAEKLAASEETELRLAE